MVADIERHPFSKSLDPSPFLNNFYWHYEQLYKKLYISWRV